MSNGVEVLTELIATVWAGFQRDLVDLESGEVDWRPVPQANNINLIVRHLRVEAEWQLAALADGASMPSEVSTSDIERLSAVTYDFVANLSSLTKSNDAYIHLMRSASLDLIRSRTRGVYGARGDEAPAHFFGYHHAIHLAMHSGHVRMIRNLFRTTRGEAGRFFPENPSFPKIES